MWTSIIDWLIGLTESWAANALKNQIKNMTIFEATRDTWIKDSPVQSVELEDGAKQLIKCGDRFEATSYKLIGDHYQVNNFSLGKRFLFAQHFKIVAADAPVPTDLITLAQLDAIAIHTHSSRLAEFIAPLNETMHRYEINTPLRICHFIAQIAHESDGFHTTREYADGSDYEWRDDLGNIYAGDGVRYRGRGLIQVTGRSNYQECSEALGYDFVANPQALESFEYATLSAGWFWDSRGLNEFADADNLKRITRIINGGYNGLEDRSNYLDRAKNVLKV